MTTEAALLAAVLADHDDDSPRLILADWWDEHGQFERAEFIRVQVELAALQHPAAGPFLVADMNMPGGKRIRRRLAKGREARWESLRHREWELLRGCHSWPRFGGYAVAPTTSGTAVIKLYPPGGGPEIANVAFRRGFVHAVTCRAEGWLAHGDAISAPDPLPAEIAPSWQPVEEVTLTTWPALVDSGESAFQRRRMVMLQVLQGRREQTYADHPQRVEELLRLEWPRVRAWHLPPARIDMVAVTGQYVNPDIGGDEDRFPYQGIQPHRGPGRRPTRYGL